MDPLSISWFKRLTIRQLDDIRDPNSSSTEILPDLERALIQSKAIDLNLSTEHLLVLSILWLSKCRL